MSPDAPSPWPLLIGAVLALIGVLLSIGLVP